MSLPHSGSNLEDYKSVIAKSRCDLECLWIGVKGGLEPPLDRKNEKEIMVILRQETQLAILRRSWTLLNIQRWGSATETIRVIRSETRWHQSSTSELSTGIVMQTKRSSVQYIKPQSKPGMSPSISIVQLRTPDAQSQNGTKGARLTQTYMSRGRSERAGNSRPVTFLVWWNPGFKW